MDMAETTKTADAKPAPKNDGPARPKRGDIQDDFTQKVVGRTNDVLTIWEPEITDLLADKTLAGKVVTYPDVDANVATSLRKHFDIEVAMRNLDRDKTLPNGEKNEHYNKGSLEIRVPAAK